MNKPIQKIHELKTFSAFFWRVKLGYKKFEVRKNDRGFEVGDILRLKEWNPKKESFTGEQCDMQIRYILEGGQFGIEKGYVVMGIEEPNLIFVDTEFKN